MAKARYAYGIACIKFINRIPHILMVKKRYTHAFRDFVFGQYDKISDVPQLLDSTTHSEKMDIMSMDFDRMWSRIVISGVPKNPAISKFSNFRRRPEGNWRTTNRESSLWSTYNKCKLAFNRNFNHDNGRRLISLVKTSKIADPIWEIPKGKPLYGELPLNTAIREVKEETDIDIDKYYIQFNIRPIVQAYKSHSTQYKVHYFIALAADDFEPALNFNNYEQLVEIEDVRWMQLQEISFLNKGQKNRRRIQSLCSSVIHTVKKKIVAV